MNVKRSLFSLLLVATLLGNKVDLAQQSGKDTPNQINRSGWLIPGLSRSRIVGRRARLQNEEPKSSTVYVTKLEPVVEVISVVSFYSVLDDSTVLVTPARLSIRSILRFDIDNHVFCYGVRAVGAFFDKKSRRGGFGGEYSLLYYDDDGDGRFERLEDVGDPARTFKPKVPNWVLHSNN